MTRPPDSTKDNSTGTIPPGILNLEETMIGWRRELHRIPETAFNENRTSRFVVDLLKGFQGMAVYDGVAGTGIVGVLRCGASPRSVALRAELDALPMEELNRFSHASRHEGCMHACGHDGHMAMLLGAARHLATDRGFDGTVFFVFQPGEENAGGAKAMIDAGLFKRFPADAVFGLHNVPGLAAGTFATRSGPLMAAIDTFEINVRGRGTHAAMPHAGVDPLVISSELVLALQSVVSRRMDPMDQGVVSVTQIHGGETWNVIPETVLLRGCTRFFADETGDMLATSMEGIVRGVCGAHGAKGTFLRQRGYPATVNSESATSMAVAAARSIAGRKRVSDNAKPVMASEDFSYFAKERPGCFMFIGNGDAPGTPMVHSPHYDFNDDILTAGAAYWAGIVDQVLSPA